MIVSPSKLARQLMLGSHEGYYIAELSWVELSCSIEDMILKHLAPSPLPHVPRASGVRVLVWLDQLGLDTPQLFSASWSVVDFCNGLCYKETPP